MARKHVFSIADPSPEGPEAEKQQAPSGRPLMGMSLKPAAPVGAITQSLETINSRAARAAEIERKLISGQAVVELDPGLVDGSIIVDRLDVDRQQMDALVAQIREHGQQVPILVRPHPENTGRYQLAYGHRRLAALRQIGSPIKAVVRELSDEQLVISQGQENNSRQNLSYIERCYFASRLENKGFSREVIMASLGVDKAALSRMIGLVKHVPPALIEAIGSAPAIGRQKWAELAALLEDRAKMASVKKLIGQGGFLALPSDGRFQAVHDLVKTTKKSAEVTDWTTPDGAQAVRISDNKARMVLTFDKRSSPKFGAFVKERLDALYDEFRLQETKE